MIPRLPSCRALAALLLAASLTTPTLALAQAAAPPAPRADNAKDALLITSVEQAYAAGLVASQSGDAAQARKEFDRAVDLLLQSGSDIKSNPALSAELDRIVDSVNTLQLDALRENSLAPAQKEDAPVDVANDVTFAVDPKIKAQAVAELQTTQSDLPLVINDYVASYINFFSTTGRGRGTIVASLQRAGKYKAMIQRVLKEEGVPQDLLYQAVAESGFRTQVVNPKSGAAGMWQFMPYGTYGLERTGWFDERFDPEKATRAYARDIKKTYAQLGDWYLAIASYDWGTGNIQRAVQRTGYADFWELYRRNNLPQETKNYVPIILAVAIMAKNPKQYGLEGVVPDAAVEPDTVVTHSSISLPLVADITGASLTTIQDLNPSLLRGRTPPDQSYELRVPAGATALFNERIAEIPEDKRATWRFHVLTSGETLDAVAREYRSTPSEIAFTNQLADGASLTGVNALVIPVAPAPVAAAASSSTGTARAAVYRVRRGDTLVNIADQFNVSVVALQRWNRLAGRQVNAGRTLYVAEPARLTRAAAHPAHGRNPVRMRNVSASVQSVRGPRPRVSTLKHTPRR